MRKYETFFITDPDLPDDVNAVVDEKLKAVITSNGGDVLTYVSWGKKRLAYTVKKHTRGHYILMEYAGGPGLVAELERNMRLDERVLKFITVKLDDRYDPEREAALKAAATPPVSAEDDEASERASFVSEEEGLEDDLDEMEVEGEEEE